MTYRAMSSGRVGCLYGALTPHWLFLAAACLFGEVFPTAAVEPNDSFYNRAELSGFEATATASTVGATREASEPNHAGQAGGASLWWWWVPPVEGLAVVDTEGSSFDTLLGIYFGKAVGVLSVIAANDDTTNGPTSQVVFDADPQRDYAIAVDGKGGAVGEVRLNLRLYTLPVILQPPGSLEATDGETVVFSLQALGKRPLTYQWQRFGTNLAGETLATLTVPAVTKAQAGAYRVIVSNSYGAVTSAPPAVLRVVERPKIAEHPRDAQREDGDEVTFSVRAFGEEPLSYSWEYKPTGLAEYQAVPGADAADLRLENLSTDEIGFYRARVTNPFGEAVSEGARLLVIADKPRITEPLTNRTVVEITNVLFTAKVRGHRPLQFRWFKDGAVIPGETAFEYLIDPARTNASGLYRFQVWNRYGTNDSQEGRLVVEPRPPNDHLANRIDLSFETNIVYGFNKNGTREPGEPAHVGQAPVHSVWWSYMATNRGVVTVDLEGSTIDTLLGIYRGTNFTELVRVAENDNLVNPRTGSQRLQSFVRFIVEAGEEYHIAVDGKNGAEADWTQNGGKGGLAIRLNFSADYGAPFFLGELNGFFLLGGGGGGGGGGGCGEASFTLKAESLVPFGYQWQYNLRCLSSEELLTNGAPAQLLPLLPGRTWFGDACTTEDEWLSIPGATNDTLVLRNLTVEHTGQYRLIAANLGVPGAVTSAPTRIAVSPLPFILTNLPAALSPAARECDYRELLFEADGGCYPFDYEWYFKDQRLPWATNSLLVFTNGHPTQTGPYYAVARGPYGGTTSAVCQVTFDSTPLFKTQPRSLSQPAKDCDELALSVELDPACRPARFQWLLNGLDVPGATNATHRFRATAETAGEYRVRAFHEFATNVSSAASVPVDARPFIEEHPETPRPRRYLVGSTFTNVVRAQSCSDLTFQWRRNGTNVVPDATHVVTQELVDADRSIVRCLLVVSAATAADSGRYDVVVSSRTGSVTSRPGDVEIRQRPPNDDFADRIALPSTNQPSGGTNWFVTATLGTNILASAEPDEPEHARQPPRRSVWWTWTSPTPAQVTLDTVGSDFDTLLSVYRGDALGGLARVMDDDQSGGGGTSRATFLAARGRVLHFAVDGSGGAEGEVRLQLRAQEIISPPIILAQPRSLAATNGATATFSVESYGSPDILYQWAFNASPIPGATNASLVITNVQERDEGNYTVHLRNEYGETNSFIARLTFGIIIEGQVTDATNRRGVPGAQVSVGAVATVTDTNGNYILVGVRPGAANADFDARRRVVRIREPVRFNNRTTLSTLHLRAVKPPGYFDYDDYQFEAKLGVTVTNKFSMSPVFDGVRFVLNWGLQPADLDAHLVTPRIDGTTHELFYLNRGSAVDVPYVYLDADVQNSYGPETLTIHQLRDGVYRYFVRNYDPGATASLVASKAVVKVYNRGGLIGGEGLYGTREVPAAGSGTYWHVCDIDGRRRAITWADEITSVSPGPAPQPAAIPPPAGDAPRRSAPSKHATPSYPGVRFQWDFGDGGTSSEVEPVHPYRAPGQYTVRLSLYGDGPGGALLDAEPKTNFITVYNEEPLVTLTSPPHGRLYKVGDVIPVTAEASDLDGEVRRVEFLRVSGGQTSVLGTDTTPPYALDFIAEEPGTVTFLARAVDDFGGVGLSRPSTVRVLDLTGDVLILRNFADPEIGRMTEWLDEIKVPTEDGSTRDLVVRVLDQEGLHFGLVEGFKLIIWNDQGDAPGGLTDNDVEVMDQADAAGIALYLMGDRLPSALYQLSGKIAAWNRLSHLQPAQRTASGGTVDPILDRPRHEFFGPNQRYGDVGPFEYAAGEADVLVLADDDAEVVARLGADPVMLRHPPFTEPDFGQTRRVVQGFRVANGDAPSSLEERRKLYLNASAWLLRLTDCRNFGGFVSCADVPFVLRAGEPAAFSVLLTQNGECTVGGVIVTNALPAGLDLLSWEILAASPRADTNAVRVERSGNDIVWRLARLASSDQFEIRFTAVPRRGGTFTNRHALSFGLLSRVPCEQVFQVEGAGCDTAVRLTATLGTSGQLSVALSGLPGCTLVFEGTEDFRQWERVEEVALDGSGQARLFVNPFAGPHRFFRARAP